ncbi:MAG: hypothetical protein JW751_29385 [Polyangiaceae bacterium]|nr:hypothetical protein [Polyangiaceae bacterium]
MNFAALDLGSNSFHLLVAARDPHGRLVKLMTHREVLQLGRSLDERGELPDWAIARALDTLDRMLAVARSRNATPLVVGTSTLRRATNGEDFVSAAWERLGVRVEVLSGDEEAELAFRGAWTGLDELPSRVAVVDLGGGSVELAVGEAGQGRHTETLPLGFLRFGDLDRSESAIRARVHREAFATADRSRALDPQAWVACGGTARAVAMVLGRSYEQGEPIPADGLREVASTLLAADPRHLTHLGVEPSRRDTIGVAATVLSAVVDCLGAPTLRVSSGGLREGLILRAIAGLDRPPRRPSTPPSRPRQLPIWDLEGASSALG